MVQTLSDSANSLKLQDWFSETFPHFQVPTANLTNANLTNAVLDSANLTDVHLFGADLSGASLKNSTLSSETLSDAIWGNTTCPDGSMNSGSTPCTATQLEVT